MGEWESRAQGEGARRKQRGTNKEYEHSRRPETNKKPHGPRKQESMGEMNIETSTCQPDTLEQQREHRREESEKNLRKLQKRETNKQK